LLRSKDYEAEMNIVSLIFFFFGFMALAMSMNSILDALLDKNDFLGLLLLFVSAVLIIIGTLNVR